MRLEELDLDSWDISYDKYACPLFPTSLSFDFFEVCQNREVAITSIFLSQSGLHSFLRFIANICPDIRYAVS